MDYSLLVGVKSHGPRWVGLRGKGIGGGVPSSELKDIKDLASGKRGRIRRKILRVLSSSYKSVLEKPLLFICNKSLRLCRAIFIGGEDGGTSCSVSGGGISVLQGLRRQQKVLKQREHRQTIR